MKQKLNPMQKIVVESYCNGEFSCIEHPYDNVGDGLFTFLMREAHDVPDKSEFIDALFKAQSQIHEVIMALVNGESS